MKAQIVLLAAKGSEIVVARSTEGCFCLPEFELTLQDRPVLEAAGWCQQNFGMTPFFLHTTEDLKGEVVAKIFFSRTLDDRKSPLPPRFVWSEVSKAELSEASRHAIDRLIDSKGSVQAPFASYVWLDQLCAWCSEECGVPLKSFLQYNASPSFSLIRIWNQDGASWFKAVGPSNRRELNISLFLSKTCPEFVPHVLRLHEGWNGWLSEECSGTELFDLDSKSSWLSAFRGLAKLQLQSVPHIEQLQFHGAADWTLNPLVERMAPFFETMPALMAMQPKMPPKKLSPHELEALEASLYCACQEIFALGIPNALVHGDLNPGNVMVAGDEAKFLDWAEAYISHPFLCAEFLLRHYRNAFPADLCGVLELKAAYAEAWKALFPTDVVDRAWQLAACIAPLLNALYLPLVNLRNLSQDAKQGAMQRSLARVMEREVNALYREVAVAR